MPLDPAHSLVARWLPVHLSLAHRLPFYGICGAAVGVVGLASLALSPLAVAADVTEPSLKVSDDVFVDDGIQRRGVIHEGERLWAYGTIPVWIDPMLSESTVSAARLAMTTWNDVAGITLYEVSGESPPEFDHVHLQPGDACASWVGRRGGAQALWIAPECNRGTLIHELGHVIGLEHEHTRRDRDSWIRINREKVRPDKLHNFDLAPEGSRLLGEYDYGSIMHYGPAYFSIDGSATIETLQKGRVIGQRVTPSDGDIAAVAELYGTDLTLDAKLFSAQALDFEQTVDSEPDVTPGGTPSLSLDNEVLSNYSVEVIVSNDGLNGAHGIQLNLALPGGWAVVPRATSLDEWACSASTNETSSATSVSTQCRLAKLAAGTRSSLRLAVAREVSLEGASLQAPLHLNVQSVTDDIDKLNNQELITEVDVSTDFQVETSGASSSADQTSVGTNRFTDDGMDRSLEDVSKDDTGLTSSSGGASHPVWWLLVGLCVAMRRTLDGQRAGVRARPGRRASS